MNKKMITLCPLLLSYPEISFAGESTEPLSAELVVEWQNENRLSSDDSTVDETNNSFFRAELAPVLRLSSNIFIDGVLVFEPFAQAAAKNIGDDIWFESNGLFAEEIKINFEYGNYTFWGGKFNPSFGTAWDYGRGIWSEDFAEDYEITEKLGVGGSYDFVTKNFGNHTFSASSFFADTTFLSGSTVTKRARTSLKDGGASNTEDFSSFTISLDGENLMGIEDLKYHMAYRFLGEQDKNRSGTADDETGFAAMLNYGMALDEDLSVDILGEYASLYNFEGVKNSDRNYYSASIVTTIYDNWNITAGYTLRDIKNDGSGGKFDDYLFQLSAGYDFQNGLTAETGWRVTEESNVDTDVIGFLIRYTKEF
ncbi:MAG: hypothetical protein R3D71_01250 [Rickettsiales bacterium]